MKTRVECTEENAPRFLDWVKTRGGVAHWRSANLSNPGASWSTPATHKDGTPATKPTWQADDKPEHIETDARNITVFTEREVKRVRVAVRRGDSFNYVLTDASDKRLKRALAEVGEGAFHRFDGNEAVILATAGETTLAQWAADRGL